MLSKAKSYAQASKQYTSISDVIKIKETFPSIGAKKINQINNIVNGSSKPKPRIQITTKGLSKKQVIIPMGNDNIVKFMKNSLIYVTNLNRNLQNVKSKVLINFIHSDPLSYASPLVWKLHPCGEVISKTYKPAFHGSHLFCNMFHGGAATIQVFCLPW